MAWRLGQYVLRGELDNRVKGKVTGRIWLAGRRESLVLDLQGNAWRDIAGHLVKFENPSPALDFNDIELTAEQCGLVGDITASRKVRMADCPDDELLAQLRMGVKLQWQWSNALYIEWYSQTNGRLVIEIPAAHMILDSDRAWEMTEQEESEQRRTNSEALANYFPEVLGRFNEADLEDDEEPESAAEAQADADAARMDLLIDRANARMIREGESADFGRILDEERERLRRERGEPELPTPTPEQEAERAAWVEEMNAAAAEALEDADGEHWKGDFDQHPLVSLCCDLGIRMHREIKEGGWLDEHAPEEHPLRMATFGVQAAGAKLAGALGIYAEDEWPPDPLFAGDTLVRLKKARSFLRDALAGLDSADEQRLASAPWRDAARAAIEDILSQVQHLIQEVRDVLGS